jgi:hypothetical protein
MAMTKEAVLNFVKEMERQYEQGDPAYFDNFDDNVVVITVSSPTRFESRADFQTYFEPQLRAGGQRKSQVLSPAIHLMDTCAGVIYLNRVTTDGNISNVHISLTIKSAEKGMKIVDYHASFVTTPAIAAYAKAGTAEEIRTLESRVATAAASVGTPK